jgi:protein phosphatase
MNATYSPQQNQPRPDSQPASPPALPLEIWGATDKGRQREGNEDYVYPHSGSDTFPYAPRPEHLAQKGRLLVVADGVGGAQAGREASSSAAKVVVERYYELIGFSPADSLRIAIEEANSSLHQQVVTRSSLQGAGTTITAAVILNNMLYLANVGDSRIYLLRNGQITQQTRDHTLTQRKLDRGIIRPDQVEMDPDRSVLTRSLGAGPAVQVDVFPPLQLVPGDVVLLCSDGVTDMMDDADIARLLGGGSSKRAAQRLISAANKRGGFDNISVVVVQVGGKQPGAGGGWLESIRQWGWQKIALLVGAVLIVTALSVLAWSMYDQGRDTPTPASLPTATPVEVPPTTTETATPTVAAPTDTTPTAKPTSTLQPTNTPTNTPLPPPPTSTSTPVPPIDTPPPTATPGSGSEPTKKPTKAPTPKPPPTATKKPED